MLDDFINPNLIDGTILDFGSGQARALAHLLPNKLVYSYDYYYYPEIKLLDIKYDNIVLIETAEHFQDPIVQFSKITNMLNPQGRLIIQTLFKPDIDEFTRWWYKRDVTHVSFMT